MPVWSFPFAAPAASSPPVVAAPGINTPAANTGFRDARYVREKGATRLDRGSPSPWHQSHDGFSLPLAVDSYPAPGTTDFVLPFGATDWLAPAEFNPREIEVLVIGRIDDAPGFEFLQQAQLAVVCTTTAITGPTYYSAERLGRVGPGGDVRLQVRARVLCPAVPTDCLGMVLRLAWGVTPAPTSGEILSVSIERFRTGGYGWTLT